MKMLISMQRRVTVLLKTKKVKFGLTRQANLTLIALVKEGHPFTDNEGYFTKLHIITNCR